MAKKIIEELVDDIDGTPAVGTTRFSLDGATYEIDLSTQNTLNLRERLADYINAAVKVKTKGLPSTRGSQAYAPKATTGQRAQSRAVREWAESKGLDVSQRGRISQNVMDRYHAEAGR